MKSAPTLLLILAVPAGLLGYAVGVRIIEALPLPSGVQETLTLFAPLFVAGLFMLPFIAPFFDRMAKRDLAAHRDGAGTTGNEALDGDQEGHAGPHGDEPHA